MCMLSIDRFQPYLSIDPSRALVLSEHTKTIRGLVGYALLPDVDSPVLRTSLQI